MKLLRHGLRKAEAPGLLDHNGHIRDLSAIIPDICGHTLSGPTLDHLRSLDVATLPVVDPDTRIGPCVNHVGKIIAIGLNYDDHAREARMKIPQEPITFFKATSSIIGPDDPVEIPRGSTKTDWEIELGVIIGTRAKYVTEEDALNHVAGYCILNDISERDFQLNRSGQWVKGKSHDTFCPIGPWLVTKDEVPDPQHLRMQLSVNGEVQQDGNTQTMHFSVAELVAFLTQFMTLEPGDIIATGTPHGVGIGKNPPTYLKDGDVMDLEIEGLGTQRQFVMSLW